VGALNATAWASFQNVPAPVLYLCEDNGFGISVRTPGGWVQQAQSNRTGIKYFQADGLDIADAWDVAQQAAEYVRTKRSPAILHLRTVRMMGHAGSDVEQLYRTKSEIEATEARDPVLATARLLIEQGCLTADEVMALYERTRARLRAMGREALTRPKIVTAEEVMQPLFQHDPERIDRAIPLVDEARRKTLFKTGLPEASDRPRHMAIQINRALTDIMLACDETLVFGEDVAKKGGVYHVTADLTKRFGVGRVFNTLLDEQSILGMAIGAGHAQALPIPEIQYLAYLMNAIDQLRGEAGSMQFFSRGQYHNPMVVRIAGLAYQKGFGGHFHNDHGIAPLLEIPGLLIGCPSRGDDAVRMLRTMVGAARALGRVCVMLEPIARYMTKDLHTDGDGAWSTHYPPPGERLAVGDVGVYEASTDDTLTIASYGNGVWMSLRVAARLRAVGHAVRVVDLRWLAPLPVAALVTHAEATGRVLIVDECRKHSGIAALLMADLIEQAPGVKLGRVTAPDSYVPLGAAANLVLVQEEDIEQGALSLLEVS
jgi:2-oxoisovalerate dehydrogenase E1 component